MTLSEIIEAIVRFIKREERNAAAFITQRQARIDAVVKQETVAIEKAIEDELAAIRTYAQQGLRRAEELISTKALNSNASDRVAWAHDYLNSAAKAL